jgi:hypothetical protein
LKVSSHAPIPRSHRNPHSIHRDPHLIHRHSHTVHRHSHSIHRHFHPVHRRSHSIHRHSPLIHRHSHSIQLQPLDPIAATRSHDKHHSTQLQTPPGPIASTIRPNCSRHLIHLQPSPMPKDIYHSNRNHHHNTHTTTAIVRLTSARVTCDSMYTFPIFLCQIDQLRRLTGRVYPTTCGLMHYKPCLPSNHRPSAFCAWSSIMQLTR